MFKWKFWIETDSFCVYLLLFFCSWIQYLERPKMWFHVPWYQSSGSDWFVLLNQIDNDCMRIFICNIAFCFVFRSFPFQFTIFLHEMSQIWDFDQNWNAFTTNVYDSHIVEQIERYFPYTKKIKHKSMVVIEKGERVIFFSSE